MSTADPQRLDPIAARLAQAWRDRQPIPAAALDVRTEDDALAVQLATWRRMEPGAARPGGWKVGAKGAEAPVSEAPLPAACLLVSGARVPGGTLRGVELELALRVCREVHEAAATSPAALASAFDAAFSAIEVVETRLADWADASALLRQADLMTHGSLVLGPAVALDGTLPDLRTLEAELRLGDEPALRTVGANPAQDLPRLLRELALHAIRRGFPLAPGQVVTTGSCTGMRFVPAGTQVRGRVGALPAVELRFDS